MHLRNTRAMVAALVLSLVLAAPAMAASSTATETLTVSSTITLTGVPASIAYPAAFAGETSTATPFQVTVSGNSASGWAFKVAASNLTGSGATIASTARGIFTMATDPIEPGVTYNGLFSSTATHGAAYPGPVNTALTLLSSTGPASEVTEVELRVAVPIAATATNYTGTVTFSATANP